MTDEEKVKQDGELIHDYLTTHALICAYTTQASAIMVGVKSMEVANMERKAHEEPAYNQGHFINMADEIKEISTKIFELINEI